MAQHRPDLRPGVDRVLSTRMTRGHCSHGQRATAMPQAGGGVVRISPLDAEGDSDGWHPLRESSAVVNRLRFASNRDDADTSGLAHTPVTRPVHHSPRPGLVTVSLNVVNRPPRGEDLVDQLDAHHGRIVRPHERTAALFASRRFRYRRPRIPYDCWRRLPYGTPQTAALGGSSLQQKVETRPPNRSTDRV